MAVLSRERRARGTPPARRTRGDARPCPSGGRPARGRRGRSGPALGVAPKKPGRREAVRTPGRGAPRGSPSGGGGAASRRGEVSQHDAGGAGMYCPGGAAEETPEGRGVGGAELRRARPESRRGGGSRCGAGGASVGASPSAGPSGCPASATASGSERATRRGRRAEPLTSRAGREQGGPRGPAGRAAVGRRRPGGTGRRSAGRSRAGAVLPRTRRGGTVRRAGPQVEYHVVRAGPGGDVASLGRGPCGRRIACEKPGGAAVGQRPWTRGARPLPVSGLEPSPPHAGGAA